MLVDPCRAVIAEIGGSSHHAGRAWARGGYGSRRIVTDPPDSLDRRMGSLTPVCGGTRDPYRLHSAPPPRLRPRPRPISPIPDSSPVRTGYSSAPGDPSTSTVRRMGRSGDRCGNNAAGIRVLRSLIPARSRIRCLLPQEDGGEPTPSPSPSPSPSPYFTDSRFLAHSHRLLIRTGGPVHQHREAAVPE
jgi:hypothetical protein